MNAKVFWAAFFLLWSYCHAVAVDSVERHFGPVKIMPSDSIAVRHGIDSLCSYGFETSLEIEGMRTNRDIGKTSWWVDWLDPDGVPYLRAAVRWGNGISSDPAFDSAFLQVTVSSLPSGEELAVARFSNDVSLAKGANTLMAESDGSVLRLYIGNGNMREVASLPGIRVPAIIRLKANRCVSIDYFAARFMPASILPVVPLSQIEQFIAASPSSSPVGIWTFLDRDTDGIRSKLGGYYVVAVVPHGCGLTCGDADSMDEQPAYDICYIDGAKVNAANWSAGMVKGFLYKTPFVDHYRLVWYDAMKEGMGQECFADIDSNTLMTLNFPLYGGKIRFSRHRQGVQLRIPE